MERRATRSVALCAALAATPVAANAVEIREWPVPWEDTRPRDPDFVNPESVWFVGQSGHYLAQLNPDTGEFRKVALEDDPGPHNLIVGRNGTVWYAGNRKGYIGRYDPATDELRRIAMPDPKARDPHTLVFDAREEFIWFTVQGGNFVGRLDADTGKVDLIPVPTRGARPYGIVVATDGTPWVALFGTHKLASVDPATLALTEHPLPRDAARPRRLDLGADGRVWYVDYAAGYLGAYDPAEDSFAEWRLPGGADSRPYGMAVDSKGRVWAVETGREPNRFVGFDPHSERFLDITPVPSGGGTIRHVDYDPRAGRIWFGTDANTIGYADVD
jgi:virginiamycin B lyase